MNWLRSCSLRSFTQFSVAFVAALISLVLIFANGCGPGFKSLVKGGNNQDPSVGILEGRKISCEDREAEVET
ncbi:MAG: hypothetical protein KDD35_13375, partial [Bdellovibrionales bacterium]|nr:hypothetical protein [Bdellovibrionales bacterium]